MTHMEKTEKSPEKLSISNPKSTHYVDNKKFLKELILYKEKVNKAKDKNIPKPMVAN